MTAQYFPPEYEKDAFHCPACNTYAQMHWDYLISQRRNSSVSDLMLSICGRCNGYSLWSRRSKYDRNWYESTESTEWKIIAPQSLSSPVPHPDMPDACVNDYQEARSVLSISPRASAALLRLCIQKLCIELGEPGKNINSDIASLVTKGLPAEVQQALDIIRVTGNNAVHPGELSDEDTSELASNLFGLINFIVADRIARPKQIQELYNRLPSGAVQAIEKRDSRPAC